MKLTADHAGDAAALRARLDLAVHASPLTASVLETGDEAAVSLPAAEPAGLFPPEYTFQACPARGTFVWGSTVELGFCT